MYTPPPPEKKPLCIFYTPFYTHFSFARGMKNPPIEYIEPFRPSKLHPQVSKTPNLGLSMQKDVLVNGMHTIKNL